jgi:peptidoglycan/LPS O-acetylase OafA/YrhL
VDLTKVSTSSEISVRYQASGTYERRTVRFYRPELDVVRFMAFSLVFINHALPRSIDSRTDAFSGNIAHLLVTFGGVSSFGLSLFFTLSAYLIGELLLRERDASGDVRVKQFYIRRILRIWPLYFAGIFIGVFVSVSFAGWSLAFSWAAWSALMLGNWFVGSHSFGGGPMGVLWSISVEEQFYLFAPWLIKRLNRMRLGIFCFALILLSDLQLFHFGRIRIYDFSVWTNSLVQFQNFAAGLLLCILLHGRIPKAATWLRFTLIGACLCCWYFACYYFGVHYQGDINPGSWSLVAGYGLATLGCVLLLLSFLGLNPSVLPNWAIYLGKISFGLYVFHDLAMWATGGIFRAHHVSLGSGIALAKGGCAITLTVSIAALSYRFFETPFLKLKKGHEVVESRPI